MDVSGLMIKFPGGPNIRFELYWQVAPLTCEAFCKAMPYEVKLLHARISGQELWSPEAPALNIPQENASIHLEPGEIAIAPVLPSRNKIAGCLGLFYGEGKLVDSANIFGKVVKEDLDTLKTIGGDIWMTGARTVQFSVI